jgi:hypothetical protein
MRSTQRKGIGLLENQAMPSLHDEAHDGWLCACTIQQQLEIPSARSWAAPAGATGTVRTRGAVRPVHHVQNHTCRVTLLQPARPAAMLGQTPNLAFGLIGSTQLRVTKYPAEPIFVNV